MDGKSPFDSRNVSEHRLFSFHARHGPVLCSKVHLLTATDVVTDSVVANILSAAPAKLDYASLKSISSSL